METYDVHVSHIGLPWQPRPGLQMVVSRRLLSPGLATGSAVSAMVALLR